MRPLVYIAGPIRKGDLKQNIANAFTAFHVLNKYGFAPICPHLSCFLVPPGDLLGMEAVEPSREVDLVTFDQWMEIDLAIVEKCDALLRLPGCSEGADLESAHAFQNQIPLYLVDDMGSIGDQGGPVWEMRGDFDKGEHGARKGLSSRSSILDSASQAVNGERDAHYGKPEDNFARIAGFWNAYLKAAGLVLADSQGVQPHEVASLLMMVKIARSINSPKKTDNWIDMAGYAACGGEVACATKS